MPPVQELNLILDQVCPMLAQGRGEVIAARSAAARPAAAADVVAARNPTADADILKKIASNNRAPGATMPSPTLH